MTGLPPFRLAVTGPRAWDDRRVVWRHLYDMWQRRWIDGRTFVVVDGAAPEGVDAHAKAWVAVMHDAGEQVKHEPWPANWDGDYGRAAGMVRNRKMIDSRPDALLAFLKHCELPPDQCRKTKRYPTFPHWTHGADQCYLYAVQQEVPTFTVEWDRRDHPATHINPVSAPLAPTLFDETGDAK